MNNNKIYWITYFSAVTSVVTSSNGLIMSKISLDISHSSGDKFGRDALVIARVEMIGSLIFVNLFNM